MILISGFLVLQTFTFKNNVLQFANFGANPESENPKNWHKTPALQSSIDHRLISTAAYFPSIK